MLLSARKSLLLLVDLQERLVPAIHQGSAVVANALWLAQVARVLEVPVLASEQYPRGLGATVGVLREQLEADCVLEKLHFSCAASPACRERIEAQDRRQVVIAGAEAHVCVLQTAVGLRERGYQVAVVAEGVGSRRPEDKALALERLRAEAVMVLCREMVAFEWLGEAGNDRFREVSKRFLR
jgi:nicotinamidase-related amidase